ncbi:sensor histidine kinase [Chryseotalea sanaruensis]|uniref:sensor histidine kinase n=1 Tax=Chryseotalea sanaruensis TaxID=2482724 RepID=UPI000F8D7CEB|nr:sensor histidine kinase [Chryseotalea sanaruensis]
MQASDQEKSIDEDLFGQKLKGFFIIFLLFGIFYSNTLYSQVIFGKVDLSKSDLTNDVIELRGNWNFYWTDFKNPQFNPGISDSTILVPGSWSKESKYPVIGYATYHLSIKLGENTPPLAISLPIINSAYSVWINGKLSLQVGTVAKQVSQYESSLENSIIHLPDTSEINLLIHVANYSYFSGGIVKVPTIGNAKVLLERLYQAKGMVNFFAGSLFAIFVYQFILFVLYPKGRPYLWLSLICLIISLRSMIVHGGSFLLPDLFAEIPTELWKKIEFGGVYILGALVALYVYHLYHKVARKLPVLILVCSSFVLLLVVVVTPQYTYGRLLDLAHAIILAGIIYSFCTIIRAKRAGNHEAIIIFYGLFAATPFFLIEIFLNNTIRKVNITTSFTLFYPVEVGLLIFLGFQVYLLAQHYAKAFKTLSTINVELEHKVNERSKELVETSLVKDKLLSIISHDVKAPINSLKGVLMLFNKGLLEAKEFKGLSENIEEELDKTSALIDSILHWSKIQLKGSAINNDFFNLKDLIESNVQMFKSASEQKGIRFEYSLTSLIICWDKHILNMVLRNLLANAIKFSHHGGQISIYVKKESNNITIGIQDYGIGMDADFIRIVTQSNNVISQPGTKGEPGNGIGLSLCKEYLTKAGGKLLCSSKLNEGTEFLICFSSSTVKA